jgi:hypothetical protein
VIIEQIGQDLFNPYASIHFSRRLEATFKDPKARSFALFADSPRMEILERLVELGEDA